MTINLNVLADMELKYILSLCNEIPEDRIDELSYYFDENTSHAEHLNPSTFSDTSISFLRSHIATNPLSIMQYLLRVKSSKFSKNKENARIAEEIMIGEIISLLDIILLDCANTNNNFKVGCLLSILSQLDIEYSKINIDDIIHKLHKIKMSGYSKEIYLSLIAKNDKHLLSALNAYEMRDPAQFKWILEPNKMVQLCFCFNKHWLMEIVLNCIKCLEEGGDMPFHSRPLGNKLWQLVLIYVINNSSPNVSIQTTINKLEKVFLILEPQNSENKMHFYINEVYREFNILKFCISNSKRNLFYGWFEKLRNHSALSVISQTCDLSQLDRFKVKQALTVNKDLLSKLNIENPKRNDTFSWDIMTYNAYCTLSTIIDTIFMGDNELPESTIGNNLNEAKIMISKLYPISYRFEILQNIFSCLFLRHEYFSTEENLSEQNIASQSEGSYFTFENIKLKRADNRGFICRPLLVKEILSIIKDCLIDIQAKYPNFNTMENEQMNSASVNEEKFKKLEYYVSSAMWRWKLITNLQVDSDSKVLSTSSLYDNISEQTSDEDDASRSLPVKRKYKTKKHRSKSDSGNYQESQPTLESDRSPTVTHSSEETDFISMLLSPPSSMLALCLEAGDFSKANRILEIFDMNDSEASIEVLFTEQFLAAADQIRSYAILSYPNTGDDIEKITGMSIVSAAVVSSVETFLSTRRVSFDHRLAELVHTFPKLQIYDRCNSSLISITDLVICTGIDRRITYGLVNVAEKKCQEMKVTPELDTKEYNYLLFLKNIINIIYDMNQNSETMKSTGICEILRTDRVPIKFREFVQQKDSLERIADIYSRLNDYSDGEIDENFTPNIHSTKQFSTLANLTGKNIFNLYDTSETGQKKKSSPMYLKAFCTYLKNITQFMYLNNESSEDTSSDKDVSVNILNLHLHNIIGDLIYEKNVSIESIEPICKKLGINLIHKLVLNCCPLISCSPMSYCYKDVDFVELVDLITMCDGSTDCAVNEEKHGTYASYRAPNKEVGTYVLVHNWVIANLVRKIHYDSTEYVLQQSLDARTKYLDIYLQEDRFDILKQLYDNNKPIAALQTLYDLKLVMKNIKILINKNDLEMCLHIIDALPERQFFMHEDLIALKDHIMLKLCTKRHDKNNWKCFISINDTALKAANIMRCFESWSFLGATEALQHICYNKAFSKHVDVVDKCREWLSRIPIYEKITEYFPGSMWISIYTLSEEDPELVLQSLMDRQKFDLCLKWSELHQISENTKNLITLSLLKHWFSITSDKPISELKRLLSEVERKQAVTLCEEMITKIRDLQVLKMIVEFVTADCSFSNQYENLRIGVEMLMEMEENEKVFFWSIIQKPLLIIEQYLMNTKLEKLAKLLNKTKCLLKSDQSGDKLYYDISLINTLTISVNAVDALLKIYAEKSLNFKSTDSGSAEKYSNSRRDDMILQSIDSINFVGNTVKFVMPEFPPPRESWAPDDSSDCCMCCRRTIFSVVVRRHHCRRCGRLICYSCSRHRLQIRDMCGDIKLRVCDDCFNQTSAAEAEQSTAQTGTSSTHSDGLSMEWCLTLNPRHNNELRREFIYEFSPSVTLCLAIMKMHSLNLDYPRFLYDECQKLSAKLTEIEDIGEILRMKQALLLWCSILYSRPLPSVPKAKVEAFQAHTHCLLDFTDALALLASRRCYSMKSDDTFRVIRNLVEAEKWELALDLSTKYGISRTAVIAPWGIACLKAGCFQQARQKFALCFRISPAVASSASLDDTDTSKDIAAPKAVLRLRRSELSLSGSQQDLTRIRNSPALLDEIVSLLENDSYHMNPHIVKSAESIRDSFSALRKLPKEQKSQKLQKMKTSEPALNVMHALSSLNKIKQGDYSDFYTSAQYVKKPKPISILKKQTPVNDKVEIKMKLDPFFYNECLFYLTSYGSHASVIEFFLKYGNMHDALKYCCEKVVEVEVFTENILIHCLSCNKIHNLLKAMSDMDNTWNMWTEYLMHGCRALERRGNFNWLYTVQEGVGDHVRAAITCASLYTRPTRDPHAAALFQRAHTLVQAKGHLQHVPRKVYSLESNPDSSKSLHLKMDNAALEKHINTISRQLEITQILYECESAGRLTETIVKEIIPSVSSTEDTSENICFLPTLFGTQLQKVKLAALIIVCEQTITLGFIPSWKIIRDYSLDASKVFHHIARFLINSERYEEILELCNCIKRSVPSDSSTISDSVVEVSVATIVRKCDSNGQLFDELAEMMIEKTENISTKITCYIECRLLKTAYLLAVENNRLHELKKIMREAERLGQTQVKNACLRKLSVKKP